MDLSIRHLQLKHTPAKAKKTLSLKDKLYYLAKDSLFVLHGAVMIGAAYMILLELNINLASVKLIASQFISNSLGL